MAITKEVFDNLPDEVKSDYVEQGDSYVTCDSLKVGGLKESLNNLDGKMKQEKSEREEALRLATEKAREEALEEAKAKNNVDDILRIEREKLIDEEARINSQREELTTVKRSLANDKLNNVIDSLSSHVVGHLKPAFKSIIKALVDVNIDTREVTFLNEDGSASSLDEASFVKELAESKTFAPFMVGKTPTDGSGLANGSNRGSAVGKNPKDMTSTERIAFKQRDPVGFKQAFNL